MRNTSSGMESFFLKMNEFIQELSYKEDLSRILIHWSSRRWSCSTYIARLENQLESCHLYIDGDEDICVLHLMALCRAVYNLANLKEEKIGNTLYDKYSLAKAWLERLMENMDNISEYAGILYNKFPKKN